MSGNNLGVPEDLPIDNCAQCKEPVITSQEGQPGSGLTRFHESTGEFLCPEPKGQGN